MKESLDVYAIRKSTKITIERPDWLVERAIVYSKKYKQNLKVAGMLGDRVFLELNGKVIDRPISDISQAKEQTLLNNEDNDTEKIDTSVISHPTYRSIANDYITDLAAIRIKEEAPAQYSQIPTDLDSDLIVAIRRLRIASFYSHQVQAWDVLKENRSIVITTPTASGKSMAFIPKVFHEAIANKRTSLLIYPLKALAADQYGKLIDINDRLRENKKLFISRWKWFCLGAIAEH